MSNESDLYPTYQTYVVLKDPALYLMEVADHHEEYLCSTDKIYGILKLYCSYLRLLI